MACSARCVVIGTGRESSPRGGSFRESDSELLAGLFACYEVAGLPRTNNDLEQLFSSHRYHERRATGRRGASPSLVLRGSARLIASVATRLREVTASDLASADREQWEQLRAGVGDTAQRRVERRRFRRNPKGYLKTLENKLIQPGLPA